MSEYVLVCTCSATLTLGLSRREQNAQNLNRSTEMLANLFEHFHGEHEIGRAHV